MSLDIIKSYLVSIGFNIDHSSLNDTQQKMNQAGETVKTFAKNNSNGVASMKNSTSDIGTLVSTSIGALAKIFPVIKGPLNDVIGHINLVKGVFNTFSKSVKQDMSDADDAVNDFQSGTSKKSDTVRDNVNKSTKNESKNSNSKSQGTDTTTKKAKNNMGNGTGTPPPTKNTGPKSDMSKGEASKGLATVSKSIDTVATSSTEAGTALETFEVVGSTAIEGLALASLGPLAIIAASLIAVTIAVVALSKFLGGLAKQDLDNQKLAKQLWTTKENAKEINMALKTMGVTMQDLWLSPVLLAQFNQLRKDSAELKLPDSFNQNIAIVQELGFEFQRLKQAGTLCMQWVGNYILQYMAGPLDDIKSGLHNFNDEFLKDIPKIAKTIAVPIGIILKLFFDLADVIGFVGRLSGDIFGAISSALDAIPKPLQDIIKIIAVLALLILSPIADIIAVILIFDDLITAIKGGKSVIGGVFTFLGGKLSGMGKGFKTLGTDIKNVFSNLGKWFGNLFEKPREAIDYIIKAIKGIPANIKGLVKDIKGIPGDIVGLAGKVTKFASQSGVNYSVPSSTKNTNSTTTSTANSNNKSSNTNTFNIVGTNPTSTASAIGKTLTSIQVRNLQGVY